MGSGDAARGDKSFANGGQVRRGQGHSLLHVGRESLALGEVLVNRVPFSQVVRHHPVHIGPGDGRVALDDGLRGGPVLEGADDEFQEDARVTDAQGAGLVRADRRATGWGMRVMAGPSGVVIQHDSATADKGGESRGRRKGDTA